MKYNVLRLYISAFHPKANVVYDLAGLLAYSVVKAFPSYDSGMKIQQQKKELTATGIASDSD
jgi:hypothetical protein